MESKILLREIQNIVNVSPRKLGQMLGVKQASLYRYINGVSNVDFDSASKWMHEFGLSLENDQIKSNNNKLLFVLHELNSKQSNQNIKYQKVINSILNLLEFQKKNNNQFKIINPKFIDNKKWQAFYAALCEKISHQQKYREFKLKNEWCPINKLMSFQNKYDEIFLQYGIKLPIGELKWL